MSALKMWVRAMEGAKKSAAITLPGLIDDLALTHNDRIALNDGTAVLTYYQLAIQMNRYARWAIKHQVAGKTVALLMPNCSDYVAIWLGLTRVGCTVALLNTNLPSSALGHCLRISGAKYLITADYIAVGPIFRTTTKENPDPVVGTELIRGVRALTKKPIVAIGGITLERAAEVIEAGADSVAVISDILRAEDPAQRARQFIRRLEAVKPTVSH